MHYLSSCLPSTHLLHSIARRVLGVTIALAMRAAVELVLPLGGEAGAPRAPFLASSLLEDAVRPCSYHQLF